MSAVQPDLFGEHDAREAEAQRWREPATCPACGTREPNGFLLNNNHGIQPGEQAVGGYPAGQHPIYDGMCVSQILRRNHIIHAVRTGDDEALERAAERGRERGLDVDAIIAEAEAHG